MRKGRNSNSIRNGRGGGRPLQLPTISHFGSVRPHPIPSLSILNSLVKAANSTFTDSEKFFGAETVVVMHQHLLETTASLVQALINSGVNPQQIFITGKSYSTCPAVAQAIKNLGVTVIPDESYFIPGGFQDSAKDGLKKLWNTVNSYLKVHPEVTTILPVADGGRLFESMPSILKISDKYSLGACEQTRGGMYSTALETLPFPLTLVASSAAKRLVESSFIAAALTRRLDMLWENEGGFDQDKVYGVIGNGAIGDAIATYLVKKGLNVMVYDSNPNAFEHAQPNVKMCTDIESLASLSDIIFSCTGRDVSEEFDFMGTASKDVTLYSVTSEDREFLTLLQEIAEEEVTMARPFDTVVGSSKQKAKIFIPGAGTPFNFDREPWNVPAHDIELTQCLMFLAILQAKATARSPGNVFSKDNTERFILTPMGQCAVVKAWESLYRGKVVTSDNQFWDRPDASKINPKIFDNFRHPDVAKTESSSGNSETGTYYRLVEWMFAHIAKGVAEDFSLSADTLIIPDELLGSDLKRSRSQTFRLGRRGSTGSDSD